MTTGTSIVRVLAATGTLDSLPLFLRLIVLFAFLIICDLIIGGRFRLGIIVDIPFLSFLRGTLLGRRLLFDVIDVLVGVKRSLVLLAAVVAPGSPPALRALLHLFLAGLVKDIADFLHEGLLADFLSVATTVSCVFFVIVKVAEGAEHVLLRTMVIAIVIAETVDVVVAHLFAGLGFVTSRAEFERTEGVRVVHGEVLPEEGGWCTSLE